MGFIEWFQKCVTKNENVSGEYDLENSRSYNKIYGDKGDEKDFEPDNLRNKIECDIPCNLLQDTEVFDLHRI